MEGKYNDIIKINPEDIFVSTEVERVSFGRLYYEEQLQDVELSQNSFERNDASYNGTIDSYGRY